MKRNKSKANFILSFPRTIAAKEVVARGKVAGHKFAANYVYAVRARADRAAKPKAPPRDLTPALVRAAGPGITKVRPDTVAAFRKAAADLGGIGKALDILNADAAVLAAYEAK